VLLKYNIRRGQHERFHWIDVILRTIRLIEHIQFGGCCRRPNLKIDRPVYVAELFSDWLGLTVLILVLQPACKYVLVDELYLPYYVHQSHAPCQSVQTRQVLSYMTCGNNVIHALAGIRQCSDSVPSPLKYLYLSLQTCCYITNCACMLVVPQADKLMDKGSNSQ
jgi:hypothetical protein